MPDTPGRRPFEKPDLDDDLWLEPHAVSLWRLHETRNGDRLDSRLQRPWVGGRVASVASSGSISGGRAVISRIRF